MKRLFKLIAFMMAMLCLSLVVSASELVATTIEYSELGVTVQFDSDTALSPEKMQALADSIVYDIPQAQTYAFCWLLGHDKVTETMTATYHKELPYDPRCRLDIYLITTCTRCDFYEEELHSSGYISCCPED